MPDFEECAGAEDITRALVGDLFFPADDRSGDFVDGPSVPPPGPESCADLIEIFGFDDLGGPPAKRRSAAADVEERIEMLDGQTELLAAAMKNYKKGSIDRDHANVLRKSVDRGRALLSASVKKLAVGDPLRKKAFAATNRAIQVVSQLERLADADDGHRAVQKELGDRNDDDHFAEAAARDGYCDVAPQQVPPCELSEFKRLAYRERIESSVDQLQATWTQAINDADLDERFKKQTLRFEQILGGVLLGVLFDVVGFGARSLVTKDISLPDTNRGGKPRARFKTFAPDSEDMTLARDGANHVITKGTDFAKGKLPTITAQQLAEKAAHSAPIPADRIGFLAALKGAALTWRNSINQHLVTQLFDEDLAALSNLLADKADEMTLVVFRKRIEAVLQRFDEQVLAIDTAPGADRRPIQVVTGTGPVRYALVQPEKRPNDSLRGEWNATPTRTSKWTFVRWIDDDMKDMAVGRAIQGSFGHSDPTAGAIMRTATDASFWDEKSLQLLAGSDVASNHEPGGLP